MKTRLDHYELKSLVNGLYSLRNNYNDTKTKSLIDSLILRIISIHDSTALHRRAKIRFSDAERYIIIKCLTDWRNLFLRAGKPDAADGVGELLIIFTH